MSKFFYALGGILPHHLSPQVRELYGAALLQNLALAMLLLFEPIYLYTHGFGITGILWFFLGVYVAYLFLMPLGAKFACRYGYEHSIAASTIVQVAYYLTLFLIGNDYRWAFAAVVLYAIQKALYWPAYHADFARYSDPSEEGREVSGMSVSLSLTAVAGPLLAGLLVGEGSWAWLFAVGSFLLLISNWPLLRTPEQFTPHDFSYRATYARLFSPAVRRRLLGYMGFGEELIVLALWPVFIFTAVKGYVEIGAVVATATLITALVTLYIGKLTDEQDKHRILRLSAAAYVASWLARLFVGSPLAVFGVDAWSRLTKSVVAIPLTTITYERAKREHVMDTIVFFEMSLVVGKIVAAALLLIALALLPASFAWGAAWILAGAMALLYVLI